MRPPLRGAVEGEAAARGRFLSVFGSLFPSSEWPEAKLDLSLAPLRLREMEAGTTILREGQACASVPFVLEGSIRVFKTAESGREALAPKRGFSFLSRSSTISPAPGA
jgi:hypothetical protein